MRNSLILILLFSCAHRTGDPLANTKRLAKEGHLSLYRNGAFQIPTTKIKLVPPGPEALALAKELSGVGAKESFVRYFNEIANSYVTVYEGHKKTYALAKKLDNEVNKELDVLGRKLRKTSSLILKQSFATSAGLLGRSLELGSRTHFKVFDAGNTIISESTKVSLGAPEFNGTESFFKGYLVFPEKMNQIGKDIGEATSLRNYVKDFTESEKIRKEWSGKTAYLIKDSFANYEKNISNTEFPGVDEYGVTLQTLKSVSAALDAIFWQGILKPVGKITSGAIGYVFVNSVAYPVMLFSKSGATTINAAVEVVKASSDSAYYFVAPSVELALSGLIYSGAVLTKEVIEKSAKGGGIILGNGVKYIAAPIASGAVTAATALSGVAVGITGATLAGSTKVTAEAAGISSRGISLTTAGAVYSGGMTYYLSKAGGEAVYEVIKATTVPPGMILGSGLTLSYGTLSQLSAQCVLAVADAAYLVLSLEGAHWVVYAVSGHKEEKSVPANSIVDLEIIQSEGAEILEVPVTEEDIKKVIDSINNGTI